MDWGIPKSAFVLIIQTSWTATTVARDLQNQTTQKLPLINNKNKILARPERFELPTTWFEARYSIQLSYGRTVNFVKRARRDSNSRPPGS